MPAEAVAGPHIRGRFGARGEHGFWSRVDRSGGPDACWPWLAAQYPTGYGNIRRKIAGKWEKYAHRAAWIYTNGPIPEGEGYHGTCVCHHCDNRPCVNPAHLFLGSSKDNMQDRDRKGRGWWQKEGAEPHGRRGRRNPERDAAIAAEVDIEKQKPMHLRHSMGAIAARYGMHRTTVNSIWLRYRRAGMLGDTP